MTPDIKRYIVGIMTPKGHRHEEMGEAVRCNSCGTKMRKAEYEYNRIRRKHPEKFVREEKKTFSRKTHNLGDMLQERLKSDALYQKHLRLLAYGTPEEKKREIKRMRNGFYQTHYSQNKTLIV